MHSLKELKAEKFRLQREILGLESGIRNDYSSLLNSLSFRNIINTIAQEIISTNLVVSQAYSIISPLFRRRRKKRDREDQLADPKPVVRSRKTTKKKPVKKQAVVLKEEIVKIKAGE